MLIGPAAFLIGPMVFKDAEGQAVLKLKPREVIGSCEADAPLDQRAPDRTDA